MALNLANLTSGLQSGAINPVELAQTAQNVADSNGNGEAYREEAAAQKARQEAQELYDAAMAANEEMQSKSTKKKTNWKLILGIGAAVAVVIVMVILLKKKK